MNVYVYVYVVYVQVHYSYTYIMCIYYVHVDHTCARYVVRKLDDQHLKKWPVAASFPGIIEGAGEEEEETAEAAKKQGTASLGGLTNGNGEYTKNRDGTNTPSSTYWGISSPQMGIETTTMEVCPEEMVCWPT